MHTLSDDWIDLDEQGQVEKRWTSGAVLLERADIGVLRKLGERVAVLNFQERKIKTRLEGLISAAAAGGIGPWLRLLDESDTRLEAIKKMERLIQETLNFRGLKH